MKTPLRPSIFSIIPGLYIIKHVPLQAMGPTHTKNVEHKNPIRTSVKSPRPYNGCYHVASALTIQWISRGLLARTIMRDGVQWKVVLQCRLGTRIDQSMESLANGGNHLPDGRWCDENHPSAPNRIHCSLLSWFHLSLTLQVPSSPCSTLLCVPLLYKWPLVLDVSTRSEHIYNA